jgi:hypothetical protein
MVILFMVEKHPSDVGLQYGRVYARMLNKAMPGTVRAVFVTGSSAIGMRLPTTDSDIVVVKDFPEGKPLLLNADSPELIVHKKLDDKVGLPHQTLPAIISTSEFLKLKDPNYIPPWRFMKFAANQIKSAAVPVFVEKSFAGKCESVLAAQPHAKNLPSVLQRYQSKGNLSQREALRRSWRKRVKPLIK